MNPTIDTKIISSFLLFVDHEIQRQGWAYSNKTGFFYPDQSDIQGIYSYTCSYKQLCNDTSISGANVMSGVWVNNSYIPVGQSGLVSVNHYDGSVNFDHQLPHNSIISGSFGVKDFSVYLSDQTDYKFVLESKYHSNPKYAEKATGIPLDEKSMPAVILVPKLQENRPFAFQGVDDNFNRIRAMVVCENLFQRVAVCNILKNFRLKQLPLINSTPIDYLGNMTGVNFNYLQCPVDPNNTPYIMRARAIELPESAESFTDATKQFAMVDFDISCWGSHL